MASDTGPQSDRPDDASRHSRWLTREALEALRTRLRKYGRGRFPALHAEIDDLTSQALSDLWEYLDRRPEAEGVDAQTAGKIAFSIFRRRAVDVFRKSAKEWAVGIETLNREEQTDQRAAQTLVLYGNHDAWPGKFPFGSSLAELDAHRTAIRTTVFPAGWPQGPLSVPIPHTRSRVLLHGVNSAIDDRWHNSFARGHVGLDPNWRPPGLLTDQLARVAVEVEQGFHPDGHTRDFRILAVHHPVHYPPPRPARTMSLGNDDEVADALIRFDQKHRGKLAQLVLSGHTHETYPRLGTLAPNAVGQSYKPLVEGQMQLIAGSLAQTPRAADRAARRADEFVPHQCQVLTFFASPRNACRLLLIERRVVGRAGGTGDFGILTAAQSSPAVESMRIEY
jgi:hypothetical protein